MNVCICGISGSMGKHIYEVMKSLDKYKIVCGIDQIKHKDIITYPDYESTKILKIDIIVDFSNSFFAKDIIKKALCDKIAVISGTTGMEFSEINELKLIAQENNINFIYCPNFAKGASLMYKLINDYKDFFSNFDLVELHAITKKDKPSGTAKEYAKLLGIENEDVQAIRLHDTATVHEIILTSFKEKFIIKHEITDRQAFDYGFILALESLEEKTMIGLSDFYEFYFNKKL